MPKDATAYLGCTIDPIVQGMEKRIRRDGTSLYLTQECPGIGLLHEKAGKTETKCHMLEYQDRAGRVSLHPVRNIEQQCTQ